jgi:hypothetical protein
MRRLKIVAIAILLCIGLTACEDRGDNQTKERSGPHDGSRGPGSPANPGNP